MNNQTPDTNIGQHFLINDQILELIASQIPHGGQVIEIGAGMGQLTNKLVSHPDNKVIALEIDTRFETYLSQIQQTHSNLEIIIGNALKFNYNNFDHPWLIGNIPYHITEPLLHKFIKAKVQGIVLLVGDSFAQEATAIETNSSKIGKLSILVHTFYKPEIIAMVNKKYFNPPPRTQSAILKLTPRLAADYQNKKLFLLRHLFLTAHFGTLLKNSLMAGLIKFENNKLTKNEARKIISKFNVSDRILNKQFEQLNNEEYFSLFQSL